MMAIASFMLFCLIIEHCTIYGGRRWHLLGSIKLESLRLFLLRLILQVDEAELHRSFAQQRLVFNKTTRRLPM